MMTITPNFNFDGKCGEAISLYQQAFGAKVDCLLHYRDADQSDFKRELSEEQKDYVYHAELYIDGQRIMMADNLDILFRPSTALSLTVTMSRKEEVLAAFEVLEDGTERGRKRKRRREGIGQQERPTLSFEKLFCHD